MSFVWQEDPSRIAGGPRLTNSTGTVISTSSELNTVKSIVVNGVTYTRGATVIQSGQIFSNGRRHVWIRWAASAAPAPVTTPVWPAPTWAPKPTTDGTYIGELQRYATFLDRRQAMLNVLSTLPADSGGAYLLRTVMQLVGSGDPLENPEVLWWMSGEGPKVYRAAIAEYWKNAANSPGLSDAERAENASQDDKFTDDLAKITNYMCGWMGDQAAIDRIRSSGGTQTADDMQKSLTACKKSAVEQHKNIRTLIDQKNGQQFEHKMKEYELLGFKKKIKDAYKTVAEAMEKIEQAIERALDRGERPRNVVRDESDAYGHLRVKESWLDREYVVKVGDINEIRDGDGNWWHRKCETCDWEAGRLPGGR